MIVLTPHSRGTEQFIFILKVLKLSPYLFGNRSIFELFLLITTKPQAWKIYYRFWHAVFAPYHLRKKTNCPIMKFQSRLSNIMRAMLLRVWLMALGSGITGPARDCEKKILRSSLLRGRAAQKKPWSIFTTCLKVFLM